MIRRSVRNKLMLSYLLVGTLLLLLFSAIVVNSIYRSSRREALGDLEALLEQNFRSVEGLIEDIVSNMNQRFISDEVIIMGLYAESVDRQLMYDIHAALREIARESRIIDTIYLYNRPLGMVFSSISAARPTQEFYEEQIPGHIDEHLSDQVVRLTPRRVVLRFVTLMPKENRWISLVLAPRVEGAGSAVVVNISQEALQSFIYRKSTDLPDSLESWIIGNDGTVISHEDPALFATDASGLAPVRRIIESPERRGEFETELAGRRVAVGFIKSSTLDGFFMTAVAYRELLRGARSYRNLFIGIAVALLMAGLIEALFFTRIIYSPLDTLVREAEVLLPGEAGSRRRSEYEIVSSLISYTSLRLSEAQRKIQEYIPEKKRGALLNLLQDTLTVETSPELWQHEYEIDLSGPFYLVGVITLYLPMDTYSGYDQYRVFHRRKSTMIEYTFGELSRLFTIQIVDVSLRQMAVIANLGTDREDLIRAGLEAAAARIVERVRREFGRPAMVCTGPIVGSIDEIPSSYGVGVELARYRLVLPDRPLLTSTDDVLSTRAVYVYPADIEKRIIDQVLLGHQQAVPPLLDEFSSRVRRFRYNEIVLSLTQLVLMISRAAPAALETSIQARWAALTSEQRLTDSRTLEEIVGWIGEVCAELVAEARRREDTAHAATVDKVKELVSKRFAESSLCAATLADSVGFSTNYLRSIFKTTTGVSLSDHIAQRRFEHAEKLLTTTTISAKEVAVMCGFFNAEYFYFAFRKRTGQTPGSYRKARRP